MANGVIFFLTQYGQTYLMADVGFTVLHNLRMHMFRRVQSLSMRFFDKTQAGRVVARLQSDVNAMQELITNGIINTIGDLLTIVGIVVVMFTDEPYSVAPDLRGAAITVSIQLSMACEGAARLSGDPPDPFVGHL